MAFTRRYLLWLVIPPAVVTIPLAFLFIAQVITLTPLAALDVALLLILLYVVAGLIYMQVLSPYTRRIEQAIAADVDASREMSACLMRTTRLAMIVLGIGGIIFAVAATLLVMRTAMGFSYFIVAALIAVFPGIAWAYAVAKKRLAA